MHHVKCVQSLTSLNNTVEQLGQTFALDLGAISLPEWMTARPSEEITLDGFQAVRARLTDSRSSFFGEEFSKALQAFFGSKTVVLAAVLVQGFTNINVKESF